MSESRETEGTESQYIKSLLSDAAEIPVDDDVNSYQIDLPAWFDEAKYKRGQQFFRANRPGILTAGLCGLISVLALPTGLAVLMSTGRSSTPLTAYKRYVLTVLHTLNWYDAELKPGSNSWKSILYVRRMHASSSKQANRKDPKMMVSQKDMAVTQFGFVGFVVLSYQKLGIQYDKEGIEGFVHIWRTIGYMLGIQERFNICTDSLASSERRMTLVLEQILRPALQTTSADFVQMTNAMIDGMWCTYTFLEYHAFMFLTRRLAGVPGHHYWKGEPHDGARPVYEQMGWHSRFMLFVIMMINEVLLQFRVVRWYLNLNLIINAYIIDRYFPYLAMIKFGIRNAYVKMVY